MFEKIGSFCVLKRSKENLLVACLNGHLCNCSDFYDICHTINHVEERKKCRNRDKEIWSERDCYRELH